MGDQNFHTKAAILILQSRMSLPVIITKDGGKKVNKWVSEKVGIK
jgi:autophagy-related protein 13